MVRYSCVISSNIFLSILFTFTGMPTRTRAAGGSGAGPSDVDLCDMISGKVSRVVLEDFTAMLGNLKRENIAEIDACVAVFVFAAPLAGWAACRV